MLKNSFFVRACFQVIVLLISASEFQRLGLPNQGFRMERIAQIVFSWKSFLMNFRIHFRYLLTALGTVSSDFFSLENRFENITIFSDITKSEPGI